MVGLARNSLTLKLFYFYLLELLSYPLLLISFGRRGSQVKRFPRNIIQVRSSNSSPEGNEVPYSPSFNLYPLSYYMRTDTPISQPFTKSIYYIYYVYINLLERF